MYNVIIIYIVVVCMYITIIIRTCLRIHNYVYTCVNYNRQSHDLLQNMTLYMCMIVLSLIQERGALSP